MSNLAIAILSSVILQWARWARSYSRWCLCNRPTDGPRRRPSLCDLQGVGEFYASIWLGKAAAPASLRQEERTLNTACGNQTNQTHPPVLAINKHLFLWAPFSPNLQSPLPPSSAVYDKWAQNTIWRSRPCAPRQLMSCTLCSTYYPCSPTFVKLPVHLCKISFSLCYFGRDCLQRSWKLPGPSFLT